MGKLETILLLVVIILVLFGFKKIPEIARNLGKSVNEVKKGFNENDKTGDKSSKDKSAK